MPDLVLVLTVVTALGCGLIAGVFFAFSAFVMPALARLPPAHGIAAMQSINVVAVTPPFMVALFGTAAGCLLVLVSGWWWERPRGIYPVAGSVLYLVGTILVTIVFNVPLNNALAKTDPVTADGARVWADYLARWTAWNHVRTLAALSAAVVLTVALIRR